MVLFVGLVPLSITLLDVFLVCRSALAYVILSLVFDDLFFVRRSDNSYRLTTEIDIDAHPNISMYDYFRYVKIVDTGNNGYAG